MLTFRIISHFGSDITFRASLQYHMPFYMQYMATWPEYFTVAEAPTGSTMAYSKFIHQLFSNVEEDEVLSECG
jgi:hypothetical protein